jgi:hypothetical protein
MRKVNIAVLAVAAAGAGACGLDEAPGEGDAIEEAAPQPLWVRSGAVKWPDGVIPVCFEDFTSTQRTAMRRLIETHWEGAANVTFTGWSFCPSTKPADTVAISVNTGLSGLGLSTIGKANDGFVQFKSDTPSTKTTVHEFGHTLGFDEENASTTAPCPNTSTGTSLEWQNDVANSVMTQTACLAAFNGLSAWDTMGVRRFYGQRQGGSLVGIEGRCVRMPFDEFGTVIKALDCGGGGATSERGIQWRRLSPYSNLLITMDQLIENACLAENTDVTPDANGFRPLTARACDAASAVQNFQFIGVEWRAMGNMCVAADGTSAGSKLSLRTCGGARQQWVFFDKLPATSPIRSASAGRIQLAGTSMCVNVPDDNPAPGAELTLASCTTPGVSAQTFTFFNGFISHKNRNGGPTCMNVSGGRTTSGSRIIMWNGCSSVSPPNFNEQFTVRGRITRGANCVNLSGGSPAHNKSIGTAPCAATPAANEVFEYFW